MVVTLRLTEADGSMEDGRLPVALPRGAYGTDTQARQPQNPRGRRDPYNMAATVIRTKIGPDNGKSLLRPHGYGECHGVWAGQVGRVAAQRCRSDYPPESGTTDGATPGGLALKNFRER